MDELSKTGMLARVRAIWRVVIVMATIGSFRPTVRFLRAIGHDPDVMRLTKHWSRGLLRMVKCRIRYEGELPEEPTLIVANHRSYTDIIVMAAAMPSRFVAKSELLEWPLIGPAIDLNDTVWVKREEMDSRIRALHKIRRMLAAGETVTVFPEGTTTAAPNLEPFQSGGFGAAAMSGRPVQPVTIEYRHTDDAWIDKEAFLPHFLRAFGRDCMEVTVVYGPVLRGNDPRALRDEAHAWIRGQIDRLEFWRRAGARQRLAEPRERLAVPAFGGRRGPTFGRRIGEEA